MATENNTQPAKTWAPASFQEYVAITIKTLSQAEVHIRDALQRLLEPKDNDLSIQEAFEEASKKYSESALFEYFKAVCSEYQDVRFLSLITVQEYRKWLRSISEQALKLAILIDNVPSADLLLPQWVNSVVPAIDAMLDGCGDDTAISEFDKAYYLRRAAESTPLKNFILNISKLAAPDNDTYPNPSWKAEFGVIPPKKMHPKGDDKNFELGYKLILTARLKALTLNTFGVEENFLVACLVSELTGITTDPETVRKTPI